MKMKHPGMCGAPFWENLAWVRRRRHPDELPELAGEGAQTGVAHHLADLGNREIWLLAPGPGPARSAARRGTRRRLAIGRRKAAHEMILRHMRRGGQPVDIQRLDVMPVSQIARPTKMHQQLLGN